MRRKRDKPEEPGRLLPMAQPEQVELHVEAVLLETAAPEDLAALAADPRIARHLLCRLSDTVALVDPDAATELADALRAIDRTPRIVREDLA